MPLPDYRRFAGKRIFITGHTGFKGSWLALWLSHIGARITGYALAPDAESHFNALSLESDITHQVGDVRDRAALVDAMQKAEPEIVLHLAAQALVRRSYRNPHETFETNIMGGVNLLEAVRMTPSVKALVFVTSDKCYENKEWVWGYRETDELGGKDPYSASKACAELVFRSYFLSFLAGRTALGCASTRAGNVIGGGDWSADRLIPDCVRSLRQRQPIVIRNPYATRPWQFVLEPISGYLDLALALLDMPEKYAGAWNFGPSGENFLNVEQVTGCVIQNWGEGELRREVDPNAVHEANLLHLSIDKAVATLGWRPIYDGRQAVAKTTEWYRRVNRDEQARAISLRQIAEFTEARKHD